MLFVCTDLNALRFNARELKRRCGEKLIAVLKYDAYGCGAAECAFALEGIADYFAVSALSEAERLIASGIDPMKIMVLDPFLPSALTPTALKAVLPIDNTDILCALEYIYIDQPMRVQLRVDLCGSGIGLTEAELPAVLERVVHNPRFSLFGLFAHAPDLYRHNDVHKTAERFSVLRDAVKTACPQALCHLATSASYNYRMLRFDAARIGTALYGLPSRQGQSTAPLTPVLSLRAPLTRIIDHPTKLSFYDRDLTCNSTRIGVVGAGYGELPALLYANGITVSVNGQIAPMVGSACMGHFFIDLDHVEASIGDPVTLVGRDGSCLLTAEDFAAACGIPAHRCDGALFTSTPIKRLFIDNRSCIVK